MTHDYLKNKWPEFVASGRPAQFNAERLVALIDEVVGKYIVDHCSCNDGLCTRMGDHVCKVNGPCNGFPRI